MDLQFQRKHVKKTWAYNFKGKVLKDLPDTNHLEGVRIKDTGVVLGVVLGVVPGVVLPKDMKGVQNIHRFQHGRVKERQSTNDTIDN